MKQLLLAIAMLCSIQAMAQKKIDSDYSKSMFINTIFVDKSQDGNCQDNEVFDARGSSFVRIEYKDFDSAGNLIGIRYDIRDENNHLLVRKNKSFSDVSLFYAKTEEGYMYMLYDSVGEKICSIIIDTDMKLLGIYNLALID